MTDARAAKVMAVAKSIRDQEVCLGREGAALAVVGWGSTYGPIHQAVRRALASGQDVAHVHIRHIWPMPENMAVLLKGFGRILVPEMNMGQLKTLLRDQFLVDARPLTKVSRPAVPHRRDRGGDRRGAKVMTKALLSVTFVTLSEAAT